MMDWKYLISTRRLGLEDYFDPNKHNRTEFQRDYDRLIFSSPFRRLQNKTQVFPLPKNIFVHNRLTHSLEVSCVGRSLGNVISQKMREAYSDLPESIDDIGTIVSAACLAHDLGNPPFGHSGETAISSFFSEGAGSVLRLRHDLSSDKWADFTHFDGNANTFRLLSHQFEGKRDGGYCLTYSTLASIVKYPYPSKLAPEGKNKFGFFCDDRDKYERVADYLGITKLDADRYARHPLVYLVEAADDICYEIMDIEDAHKLRMFSLTDILGIYLQFFDPQMKENKWGTLDKIKDENEQVAYVRSSIIGLLVKECAEVFMENYDAIMAGTFEGSLLDHLSKYTAKAFRHCQKMAAYKIYPSREVADVEISGYNIMYTLIEKSIDAMFCPDKAYSKQILKRIPDQYRTKSDDPYQIIMSSLDFVSGMTDVFALDLYRKITGMSLPEL